MHSADTQHRMYVYCPVIWGFYVCSKDGKPERRTGNNWYLDHSDAKELLEEKVTIGKSLKFSFSSKEFEDKEERNVQKR